MTATEGRCFCCRLLPEDREWLEEAYRAFSADRRRRGSIEIRGANGERPVVMIIHREAYRSLPR